MAINGTLTFPDVPGRISEHNSSTTAHSARIENNLTNPTEGKAADAKATKDLVENVSGQIEEEIDALNDEVTDLKSAVTNTQDWLGYPSNKFNPRTFQISNSENWSIDAVSSTSITITHKTTYSVGAPIAVLDLPTGKYDFHADYTGSNTQFSLRTNGSWVKALADGSEIDIDSSDTNEIYFSNSTTGTYVITGISIVPQEVTGKIPTLESTVSVLVPTVDDLVDGFNDIATPVITEIEGVETQSSAIGSNGNIITAGTTNYRIIKYEITVGKTYWITANTNYGNLLWAFYDASNNLVLKGEQSSSGSADTIVSNREVTAPGGSTYLIIAYNSTVSRGYTKTQTGFNNGAEWKDKKWVCVGDSLTAENTRTTKHYFDYISDVTGITVVNMGVSGSGYARMADTNNAFYQRISSCPVDADVVTIFGSFNDIGSGLPLGTVTDTSTSTIAGCINTTITNLQAVIPLVNLGIVAPTPWDTAVPATSGVDYNYVEMIKAICEKRSIPYLDLWRSSNLRPWDADFRTLAYSKDDGNGTHPDENGHKLIAPRFKGFLETLLL